MLRFVQGIHKAFRSNQAYAPCQKAANDKDEYENRPGDSLALLQRRSYTGLSVAPPLPQSTSAANCTSSEEHEPQRGVTRLSNNTNREYHSTGYTATNAFLPGALVGAGFAVFNSVHAFCSGKDKRRVKDRSKFCPVARYEELQRSSAILRSIGNLVPGRTYDVTPGFSVLPKASVQRTADIAAKEPVSIEESAAPDNQVLRQKEYERAQDEVNALADTLCSIDKENLAADHFLAMRAWNRKDFVSAAGIWQRTVDKFATPIAAHRLGIIYENGHGVPKDYQQASAYYKLAISHQCSKAMFKQAMLQISGLVTGQTDSMELLKQSADLNYAKAQTYLGTVNFHQGKTETAVKYYEKAAKQDDIEALYYLGICHETGAGFRSKDDSKAAHYYLRAAEGGHPDAQFNLAMFYEEGCGGLGKDEDKCIEWLRKSAKQGCRIARDRLIELGCWNIAPSASLPTIDKHIVNTLSDLAVEGMTRALSDNCLPKRQGLAVNGSVKTPTKDLSISAASSSSSLAGTPQFYIPSGGDDEEDVSSFVEWSDEGLSSASSSSLCLDRHNDKFSIDFTLKNTGLDPSLYSHADSWGSLSNSSLRAPEHDGPQITFA